MHIYSHYVRYMHKISIFILCFYSFIHLHISALCGIVSAVQMFTQHLAFTARCVRKKPPSQGRAHFHCDARSLRPVS